MFFFELLAPIIEFIGLIVLLYLAFTGGVNWYTAWIIFGAVFVFNFLVSITIILYDWLVGPSYRKFGSYVKLVLAAILEPFRAEERRVGKECLIWCRYWWSAVIK